MNKQKILTYVIIGIGAFILIFFGMRVFHSFNKMRGHGPFDGRKPPIAQETDVELIRDWMPIPYIAHTYAVPEPYLLEALNLSERDTRKKNLKEINDEYFPDEDGIVLEKIKAAVKEFQSDPPQPPDAPDAPEPPFFTPEQNRP